MEFILISLNKLFNIYLKDLIEMFDNLTFIIITYKVTQMHDCDVLIM